MRREWNCMEQWCPICDISTLEAEGKVEHGVWRCNPCIEELAKPTSSNDAEINKVFNDLIKELSDE